MEEYDKVVLEEGDFTVELSNHGRKFMFNPNPQNLEKNIIKCKYPECKENTKTIYGLCTIHNNAKGRKEIKHTADWFGWVVPKGYRREDCRNDIIPHHQITEILIKWMDNDEEKKRIMDGFVDDVLKSTVGNIPDATTLQKNLKGQIKNVMTPDELVEFVKRLVNKHFPKAKYENTKLPGRSFKGKSLADIPIRIIATLLILAWACEESNRGDAWFCKINKRESKYGNAYMPSVYYFLRRYTDAKEKQAEMCLRH